MRTLKKYDRMKMKTMSLRRNKQRAWGVKWFWSSNIPNPYGQTISKESYRQSCWTIVDCKNDAVKNSSVL